MLKVFKTEIKWAIVIGILQLLWLILEFFLGFHDDFISYSPIVSLSFYVPIIFVIYYAIKENKEGLYEGNMDLMKGIKTGFFTALFAVPLMAIVKFAFFTWASPDYFSTLIDYKVSTGFNRDKMILHFTLKNHLRELIFFPSMGLLFSLLGSFLLKNK